MPPPWSQPFVKDLDPDVHMDKVYPMGDFRSNPKAMARKLDSLLGLEPETHKSELLIREQRPSERPLTRQELWEQERSRAKIISEEAHDIALKKDSGAWADSDGYAQVREAPAFRDGYNTTLRVKPSQEEHLHNGLSALKPRNNPQAASEQGRATKGILKHDPKRSEQGIKTRQSVTAAVANARASDQVHRKISQRADFAQAIGAYFMRGVQNGVLLQAEQEVESGTLREEIKLLLRAFEPVDVPESYVKESSSVEHSRMKNTEVFQVLGNAFVNLGMTLPAGTRDDPLRNDVVALELGNTIMQSDHAGIRSEAPNIEESMRTEIATALGRAILHIRNAAGIQANSILRPTSDTYERDRAFKSSVGKLTLQLLEGASSRPSIPKDLKRREVFIEALGGIMIKMEAMANRTMQGERNKEDKSGIHRLPAASGPTAKRNVPEVTPTVRPERPIHSRVGSTLQKESTARESHVIRKTNTGDHLVTRPIVPLRLIQNV